MVIGWIDENDALVVVDYKSTSKPETIEKLGDSPWEQQYTRQLGVYRWLLEQNGFTVNKTAYLVYANADSSQDAFDDKLVFETTLVPVETTVDWIDETLAAIKATLEAETLPGIGERCEYCPYREAAGKKLQAIHFANKK